MGGMRIKCVLSVAVLFLAASCSNQSEEIGRYQVLAGSAKDTKAETSPVLLKIDTSTGQTWRYSTATPQGATWLPIDLK
jgi:hypothetical protein